MSENRRKRCKIRDNAQRRDGRRERGAQDGRRQTRAARSVAVRGVRRRGLVPISRATRRAAQRRRAALRSGEGLGPRRRGTAASFKVRQRAETGRVLRSGRTARVVCSGVRGF